VLVLAPTNADALLTEQLLREADIECHVCRNVAQLGASVDEGSGAALVTEELFVSEDAHLFLDALRRQPPWSDLPILFLSSTGADSASAAWAIELLGNVTVLERPVRLSTLISALRTAIRARRRQYELRNQFLELKTAEATLRRQSERQRLLGEAAEVLLTSDDLEVMLRALFEKIAPHFALDAYFNYMLSESRDALQLESFVGVLPNDAAAFQHVSLDQDIDGKVAAERRPIVLSHLENAQSPYVARLQRQNLRSYVSHPLIADERMLGTLAFGSRQRDHFDNDEVEFMQTICHYVTAAYERVRLIRELKDAARRKDEFLATLAHELRNPLAPIRNSLHIMRLAPSNSAAAEQARAAMDRQLGQMVRLIDDLLDVSRITRGKLELRKERVDLATVVNMAVDTTRPLIEACGHTMTIALPKEPLYLDADPMRIAQVFANLINNAAKYMDRGGRIWVTAVPGDGNVAVSVRDAGIGIPEHALDSLFEMFTQVDNGLARSQGGLGIGLTLVKRLVELHGGSVEARSAGAGKGSEFVVQLPTAARPANRVRPREEVGQRENIGHRVLVADDNRDAAETMSLMLRFMGHEVRTVHDGAEALSEAAQFRPDFALLDIGMPHLNGYEVARAIRKERWGSTVRLIALTGWGQDEDRRRAIEAGFDHHFTKPVDPDALQKLLAQHPAAPIAR
jgi:signal transduction histidine kinase/DNA-binding response OmpR family regulator